MLHLAPPASTIVSRIAFSPGIPLVRLLVLVIVSLLALAGCHAKSDPPGEAPTGVTPKEGDGLVVLSWQMLPDLTYWIFFAQGTSVGVGQTGSVAIRRAIAPRPVTGLLNETQYAFIMNATHNDSAAGPSSPVVVAKPRLAGKDWEPDSSGMLGTRNLRAIAFNGSRFVVVGDAATIFAGDYNYINTNPQGVSGWTAATLPQGFAADVSAVLFSTGYVALGRNGAGFRAHDRSSG